jgi:hypothetical protein
MAKLPTKTVETAASTTDNNVTILGAFSLAALGLTLPATKSRGTKSKYAFDSLTAVGMVLGVKGKEARNLSSVVSNANRKYVTQVTGADGLPVFETKQIAGADGQIMNVPDTTKPVTTAERKFRAVEVTAEIKASLVGTPLEGSDALIERVI